MFALSIIYLGFYTVTRNIGFKIVILLVIIDDYIVANYWPHFVALKFISWNIEQFVRVCISL